MSKTQVSFEVKKTDTIGTIKRKICLFHGIAPKHQKIIVNGVLLDDTKTLSYYNINSQSDMEKFFLVCNDNFEERSRNQRIKNKNRFFEAKKKERYCERKKEIEFEAANIQRVFPKAERNHMVNFNHNNPQQLNFFQRRNQSYNYFNSRKSNQNFRGITRSRNSQQPYVCHEDVEMMEASMNVADEQELHQKNFNYQMQNQFQMQNNFVQIKKEKKEIHNSRWNQVNAASQGTGKPKMIKEEWDDDYNNFYEFCNDFSPINFEGFNENAYEEGLATSPIELSPAPSVDSFCSIKSNVSKYSELDDFF